MSADLEKMVLRVSSRSKPSAICWHIYFYHLKHDNHFCDACDNVGRGVPSAEMPKNHASSEVFFVHLKLIGDACQQMTL